MYEIGQTFDALPPKEVFDWCEANDAHIWELYNDGDPVWQIFENYHPEEEEARAKRQAKVLDRLETLLSETMLPSDKVGQLFRVTKLGDVEILREYVPDPEWTDDADGSYLKPYRYVQGMSVTEGMWYTDGEDIWEAIKDGIPSGFDDEEYFDIVTV